MFSNSFSTVKLLKATVALNRHVNAESTLVGAQVNLSCS